MISPEYSLSYGPIRSRLNLISISSLCLLSSPALKTNVCHFSKSHAFLFSSFLTPQEQAVDTFDHSFLLEMLPSPELQGIMFSRFYWNFYWAFFVCFPVFPSAQSLDAEGLRVLFCAQSWLHPVHWLYTLSLCRWLLHSFLLPTPQLSPEL